MLVGGGFLGMVSPNRQEAHLPQCGDIGCASTKTQDFEFVDQFTQKGFEGFFALGGGLQDGLCKGHCIGSKSEGDRDIHACAYPA